MDLKICRHFWVGPVAVAGSVVLSAGAQLFMKAGMLHVSSFGLVPLFSDAAAAMPVLVWLIAGFGCYGLSLLAWLIALSQYPLSFAYPLLSISYVLVYLAAAAWPRLAEPLSETRTVGIAMVMAGVVLVASSSPASKNRKRPATA